MERGNFVNTDGLTNPPLYTPRMAPEQLRFPSSPTKFLKYSAPMQGTSRIDSKIVKARKIPKPHRNLIKKFKRFRRWKIRTDQEESETSKHSKMNSELERIKIWREYSHERISDITRKV